MRWPPRRFTATPAARRASRWCARLAATAQLGRRARDALAGVLGAAGVPADAPLPVGGAHAAEVHRLAVDRPLGADQPGAVGALGVGDRHVALARVLADP